MLGSSRGLRKNCPENGPFFPAKPRTPWLVIACLATCFVGLVPNRQATGWVSPPSATEPTGADPQIDAWIRDLGGTKFALRDAAERGLTHLGAATVPQVARAGLVGGAEAHRRALRILASLFDSKDEPTRAAAAKALESLAKSGDKRAATGALSILVSVERRALDALKGKVTVKLDPKGRVVKLSNVRHSDIGGLRDTDLPTLAAFRSLSRLELTGYVYDDYYEESESHITDAGLIQLARLDKLEHLDLTHTPITDIGLRLIANLPTLRSLRFNNYRKQITVQGLNELARLERLESLDLDMVTPAALRDLKDIPSLRTLSITRTPLDEGVVAALSRLSALQELNVSKIALLQCALGHWISFPHLKRIGISVYTYNVDHAVEELAHLHAIEGLERVELAMSGARSYDVFRYLCGLSSLRKLDLASVDLRKADFELLPSMRGLESLDLSGSHIESTVLVHVGELTALRRLDLVSIPLNSGDLCFLRNLRGLETLSLQSNDITDDGLRHLRNLKALRTLNLQSAKVTDAGLVHLDGLLKLSRLNLINNPMVTEMGVQRLRTKLPDCQIDYDRE